MRKIRPSSIERVLAATDIAAIIGAHVHLRKAGGRLKGLCPFHQEKTPSFSVDPEKRLYHCFGCQAGGNSVSFLMEKQGMGFVEAIEYLAERSGVELEYESGAEPQVDNHREHLLALNRRVLLSFRNQLAKVSSAQQYLQSRHLTQRTIDDFGLGYADGREESLQELFEDSRDDLLELGLLAQDQDRVYDRFRQRIMFPLWDVRGQVVGFAGRDLSGRSPAKYMNSPESDLFDKKRLLYGYHLARGAIRTRRRAFVVEGYFDVIRAHQCGLTETVAIMGTSFSVHHARLLGPQTAVYLVFDGDSAGFKAALRSSEILTQCDIIARVVFLPEGEDPDSFLQRNTPERFEELVASARDIGEFLIDQRINSGQGDVASLAVAVKELREFIARIPDSIKRQAYTNYLRELTHIDPFGQGAKPSLRSGSPATGIRRPGNVARKNTRHHKKPIDKMYVEKYLLRVMFHSDDLFEEISHALGGDMLSSPFSELKNHATKLHLQDADLDEIQKNLSQGALGEALEQVMQIDLGEVDIEQMRHEINHKIENLYLRKRHQALKRRLFASPAEASGSDVSEPERQQMLQELMDIQRELSL
ncbi:DNA primase [Desulfurispira natronophila]|uniref:DNA primase n=1 Tax=Desulfurispira natronophila TaxID=682562 RepID=A0A7W7Y4K9_9BACT|nr:DNA primase [Desulfurispira natronophila]MBB5021985.1 DNA primase [Desulfurispira natronophila]